MTAFIALAIGVCTRPGRPLSRARYFARRVSKWTGLKVPLPGTQAADPPARDHPMLSYLGRSRSRPKSTEWHLSSRLCGSDGTLHFCGSDEVFELCRPNVAAECSGTNRRDQEQTHHGGQAPAE